MFISASTVRELSSKAHSKGGESSRILRLDLEEHLRVQGSLPLVHRDPFDRMLIALARVERMQIVSNEALFPAYGISRVW